MLWEMSHTPVTAENTSRAISRDRPYARIDQAGLLWLLDGNRLVELFREHGDDRPARYTAICDFPSRHRRALRATRADHGADGRHGIYMSLAQQINA